jgi:3-hydroxyisobutyrate dehydrogenase-like beta-hydroxyacid dehydrogenase
MKLLGNTCILGTIELLGEVFTLADAIDFDNDALYSFIRMLSCSLNLVESLLSLILQKLGSRQPRG